MKSALIKVIFILLLAAALLLVLRWDKTIGDGNNKSDNDSGVNEEEIFSETIIAEHYFSDGVHELRGTFSLPNPCYEFETGVAIAESYPEQVTAHFTVRPPDSETTCIQVIEERKFSIFFDASPNPIIRAEVNGRPAVLVLEDKAGVLTPIDRSE